MTDVKQGFDPLDPRFLMQVIVTNADRQYLNASVGFLIEKLAETGQRELLGDFIQLTGTGVALRSKTEADGTTDLTEEEIEKFTKHLDTLPEGDENG